MKRHTSLCAAWLVLLLGFSSTSYTLAQEHTGPILDPAKAITEYVHVSWDEEAGLPQGSVNAVEQTADGYVWLGTQEGLVRFDGSKFTVFNTQTVDVFRSNDIRVLKRDKQGALWIGTLNAGMYRYFNGVFTSASHNGLLDAGITAIQENGERQLWIGTAESGLKLLRDGTLISIDQPARSISALHQTASGTLWIGSRDAGLIRYENGHARVYTQADGLPDNDVTSIAASRDGGIWIGTREGGLAHFHSDTFYVASVEHGLPSNQILALLEDAAGSLWIGTDQAGLARLRLEPPDLQAMTDTGIPTTASKDNSIHAAWKEALQFSSFASPNGLTYDVVKTLFVDREGNLLIGTDGGGLNLLREGKFTMYTEKVGLPDDFVYAIHEDHFGAIWFSTHKGVGRLSKGTISSYSAADGLAGDFVISLASTPDSSVWMGTYDGGLSRFYKGAFTTFTQKNGLPANRVYGLYSDSKGHLWIGTGDGAARMHENRITTFTSNEGLSSDLVTVMQESQDGAVWIGTYNAGLNKVRDDKFVSFDAAQGLADIGVLSLYEDEDGVLWIGSYGDGLIRVKDGEVTSYTTKNGLFNDTILQILEDDLGYLWMSCNQGLFRVEKKQLNEYAAGITDVIHSVVYGKGDGLRSNEFNGGVQNAGWKSRDGRLWFPSRLGVASIDPKTIRKNETPPLIQVENVLVDGDAVPLEGPIHLEPGTDRMEIHYAGLTLVSPEKVRYQYQLSGEDQEWVEAGTRRIAYYSNLEPGAYSFRVRAQNKDGVWSKGTASFSFYHEPFFHQTFWFYLMCLSVVILGVTGVFKWRMTQLREQKANLEHLVHERTHDLEERTADLVTALEENKEILSITSHDLKNPLSGIIGLSELLIEDLSEMHPTPKLHEGLESIQLMKDEAERMLRIVRELLDRHQAIEKVYKHPDTFNLVRLVNNVMQRHQKHAEEKNIRLIFENKEALFIAFNEDAMLRIADNLISNAIKFSPQNRRVWVSLTTQQNDVMFSVQDEGPGLTADDRERVFGKLQKLSAKPTGGEQSTGWGLFIVKQLAEECGATVGVESEFGNGASFWVSMPLRNARYERKTLSA